jgi:IclR family pca regulon transcriptional regulator
MDVRDIALPHLREPSRVTGQTVNPGILDGLEVVYVERIKKRRILTIDLYVGSRLNAYDTSIGQAILTSPEKGERKKIIRELTKDREALQGIGPDGGRLTAVLEEVRKNG